MFESLEKSPPPRLALPSNAPPTSTIAITATTASARRQWDGAATGGAGGDGWYDPYDGYGGSGAAGVRAYGGVLCAPVPKSCGGGAEVGCAGEAVGCVGASAAAGSTGGWGGATGGGGAASAACNRGLFSSPGSVMTGLPHGGSMRPGQCRRRRL